MITLVPLDTINPTAVEMLLDAAFGPDRFTRTAYMIRGTGTPIAALSFAAIEDGALVGSIQCWPIALIDDARETPLEMVGPVAVAPTRQGDGIGRSLVAQVLDAAAANGLDDALMLIEDGSNPTGTLTKGEREMIVTVTSAANKCLYCVVAHGAILRIYEKKPLLADQVAVNYRKADISPRQRAMLDFAMKVCLRSADIEDADFKALMSHGFNDEDAWDIAAITAFFGLSNRMASFTGMLPNPDFYLMGRVPREKKA